MSLPLTKQAHLVSESTDKDGETCLKWCQNWDTERRATLSSQARSEHLQQLRTAQHLRRELTVLASWRPFHTTGSWKCLRKSRYFNTHFTHVCALNDFTLLLTSTLRSCKIWTYSTSSMWWSPQSLVEITCASCSKMVNRLLAWFFFLVLSSVYLKMHEQSRKNRELRDARFSRYIQILRKRYRWRRKNFEGMHLYINYFLHTVPNSTSIYYPFTGDCFWWMCTKLQL